MGYNAFPSFMDSADSLSSTGLEWHNLALYPIEIPFSMSSSSSSQFAASSSSSTYPHSATGDDFFRSISEPLIGLGLGTQNAFVSGASIPVSSTPTKRCRASYQNMQNPCCQVQGCNLDLKSAKDYHRRHRICENHSKSPKVIVAGKERRFCQQCSRFHDLSEFDDKKRSCRRRLSDHNARRRRVQPESIQITATGISASLYDQRQQNGLLSGLPISLSNPSWETAGATPMSRHALLGPTKARGPHNFPIDDIHSSISNLHMDSERLSSIHNPNPRLLDPCLHIPNANESMGPDLVSAHSLLSSHTWRLNEGESSTMVHGNYNAVMSSSINPVQQHQGPPPLSLHNGNHQEYQLFNDSAAFYSSQRYL